MSTTRLSFPDGFLWGAATSSHQVEGGQRNDWTDWEATPGRVHDGTVSGDACGWWAGRAEEDLRRAAALGHGAHRLSLEWSRLEPEPGVWDEVAADRYRAILRAARAEGLRTFVTLHHFTLPRWVAARGGWADARAGEALAAYAKRCARAFEGLVDAWLTINEPGVLVFEAYAGTAWPPGAGDLGVGARALRNQLRGHAQAYRALREVRADVPVGLALNLPCFEPSRPGATLDRLVAGLQSWAMGGAALHALRTGRCFPPVGVVPTYVPGLAGAVDFVGVNYYGRYDVRFDRRAPGLLFGRHVQEGSIRTATGDWGAPCPAGLTRALRRAGAVGVPVYVTENGVMDADDAIRPAYLVSHVEAVHDAIRLGVDVRGYFHWSLVDNFEWAEGWSAPFGLVAVDRASGARAPRRSALVYQRIIEANGVPDALEVTHDELH